MTHQVQKELDEVALQMRDVVGKVAERGEKLGKLDKKSEELAKFGELWKREASATQKKMKWRRTWMGLLLCAGILIIAFIVLGVILAKR
jgi:hypothetical protein